ncbi:glycosyltransferase family 2 protein [Roseateles microcysteis]|uniref:glycosyltransferase family 2 protein n=1 Tax=Roseateles microcysteis TaxID=3119057 RepID=UPI002FE5D156
MSTISMDATGDAQEPEITVLVLCYRHRPFLADCLASVAGQTWTDFELIVCDDASDDGSAALIEQCLSTLGRPACFVRHTCNLGLCGTLVELLGMARGRHVAMIAADDLWAPERLAAQLAVLRQHPEAAMVYSDAHQIDESGALLPGSFMQAHQAPVPAPSGKLFAALVERNFIPAMATLIRRSAIDAVGGYDASFSYEDYDMWLRLAARFPIVHLPGRLASYRIVASSMVRTMFARPDGRHFFTEYRIHERWLDSGLLSDRQRQRWVLLQANAAYGMFCTGHPRAAAALWKAAQRDSSRRASWLLRSFLCAIGLHRPRLVRLLAPLKLAHRE